MTAKWECEAAGHVTPPVRRQRGVDTVAQPNISFTFTPESTPAFPVCLPAPLNLETPVAICTEVCSLGDTASVKLTEIINRSNI